MDVYGRWATIATNGDVSFATNEFRITTTNFPAVFVVMPRTALRQSCRMANYAAWALALPMSAW